MDEYPKLHLKIVIALVMSLIVAIVVLPTQNDNQTANIPISLSIETMPAEAPVELAQVPAKTAPQPLWKDITVKNGDSVSSIFTKAGLSATDLHYIMNLGSDVAVLSRIQPGKTIQYQVDQTGKLQNLSYQETPLSKLSVNRVGQKFKAEWDHVKPEILISYKTARITHKNPSLYHAGKEAGLSDNLIMQLSYVFQWDISFALDIRRGDTFTVLYEDVYVEGEKIKEGVILAAVFNNMGRSHTAVLYENRVGQRSYFTPEGRSMRKAFLRDPVHFSRVSSSFNMRRLHPIHKKVMPHRGIDYAASKGTPVVSSGDGKVTVSRRNSASGRYIVIKHGERYTTKYLHLSAFAKGIRAGKQVKQGQTIGYVGATGWATAPHLHYEFLVNGVHRNPKTVKLPKAEPIHAKDLTRFQLLTQPVIARLESVSGLRGYASAASTTNTSINKRKARQSSKLKGE